MDIKTLKELLHLGVEKMVEDLEKSTTEKQKDETKDAILIGMAMNDELPSVVLEQNTASPVKKQIKQKGKNIKKTSGVVGVINRRKIPDELLSKEQLINRRIYEMKKAKETPEQREHRLEYLRNYHQRKKEEMAKEREKKLAKMRSYAKKKYWEKKNKELEEVRKRRNPISF